MQNGTLPERTVRKLADILCCKVSFAAVPCREKFVVWRNQCMVGRVRPVNGIHGRLPVLDMQREVLIEVIHAVARVRR